MTDPKPAEGAPEPTMPANVIAALARVMSEMPAVGKDASASAAQGGYSYRSIEAITAAAQHLLGRYGVVFVPRVIARNTVDFTVNSKPWTEEQLTVIYTVYGPGGVEDRIEVGPLHALGRDNSDKGTNKCMTQAFKYALLQVLCIGDSKDDGDATAAQADAHVNPENWFVENGWRGQLHHDETRAEIAAAVAALPDEAKPALKAWLKDQTGAPEWRDPWPEPYARAVSERVKALSVPASPAEDDEKAPSAPQTPNPAPEAESPAPADLCPWCQKPAGKTNIVLRGGHDADHPLERYHKACVAEMEAEEPA